MQKLLIIVLSLALVFGSVSTVFGTPEAEVTETDGSYSLFQGK